jgi:hypothetical protein
MSTMTSEDVWSSPSLQVTTHYGRQETSMDVLVPGVAAPVARLVKAGRADSAKPYRLTVGAELAGLVGGPIAYGADGVQVGRVDSRRQALRGYRWSVDQPGLGTLTAKAVGASGLRYRWPQSMVLAGGPASNVLPFEFRFTGGDSAGFTVRRRAGVRATFEVTVHDPRVDRRLVLAAVVNLSVHESGDVRQEIADITGNPFDR